MIPALCSEGLRVRPGTLACLASLKLHVQSPFARWATRSSADNASKSLRIWKAPSHRDSITNHVRVFVCAVVCPSVCPSNTHKMLSQRKSAMRICITRRPAYTRNARFAKFALASLASNRRNAEVNSFYFTWSLFLFNKVDKMNTLYFIEHFIFHLVYWFNTLYFILSTDFVLGGAISSGKNMRIIYPWVRNTLLPILRYETVVMLSCVGEINSRWH